MPTKLSSYLTELGFRQIEHLGDVVSYNKENGGEYIVVKENNRLYRYDANSTQPIDNLNVTPTLDGGNTRWIAVGGAAMTQTRVVYTFTETSNTVPLGMKVLAKANILYVNIHNTQILSDEFSLNSTKDAIILSKSFEAGVKVEVVIVIGDFTPDPYDYTQLSNLPRINGVTLEGNKTSADLQLVAIDDTNASTTTVYSSNKVNTLLNKKLTNNLLTTNVDLNTLRETGIYTVGVIYSFGHGNLHLPYIDSITKNATWIIDVNQYGGIAQVVQTAYIVPNSQISPRTFRRYSTGIGDSWSEWYQIAGPGLDMPSNKTVDILLQASGATYTAEANGYVSAACGSWNDNAKIALNTSGILYNSSYYPTAGAGALSCSVPVSKGQAYSLVYENTTPNVFKFTYANSEVPMNERYPNQEVYTSNIVVNVTVNGTAPNATEFKVGNKDFTSTYNAFKEGNVYFQISHVQEETVAWSLTLESGTATPSSGEITLNGSKITINITVDNAG